MPYKTESLHSKKNFDLNLRNITQVEKGCTEIIQEENDIKTLDNIKASLKKVGSEVSRKKPKDLDG